MKTGKVLLAIVCYAAMVVVVFWWARMPLVDFLVCFVTGVVVGICGAYCVDRWWG
jgi:uncharacterized membrane protein